MVVTLLQENNCQATVSTTQTTLFLDLNSQFAKNA